MYYRSRTDGRCYIGAGQTLHMQCTHQMAAFFCTWNHDAMQDFIHALDKSPDVMSKTRLRRSDLKRRSLKSRPHWQQNVARTGKLGNFWRYCRTRRRTSSDIPVLTLYTTRYIATCSSSSCWAPSFQIGSTQSDFWHDVRAFIQSMNKTLHGVMISSAEKCCHLVSARYTGQFPHQKESMEIWERDGWR